MLQCTNDKNSHVHQYYLHVICDRQTTSSDVIIIPTAIYAERTVRLSVLCRVCWSMLINEHSWHNEKLNSWSVRCCACVSLCVIVMQTSRPIVAAEDARTPPSGYYTLGLSTIFKMTFFLKWFRISEQKTNHEIHQVVICHQNQNQQNA